ncbi:hypothetical protein AGMMS49579_10090 [Spirochaetia bacterium]|nr:hypothetical protein AGMMS49579_10090 [Spirochaetia bacterium]
MADFVPEDLSAEQYGISVLPCLTGAAVSVALIRSGPLAFFFLIPLGVVAASYNRRTAWATVLAAVGINVLISLGLSVIVGFDFGAFVLGIFYFTLMITAFVWILSPPVFGPAFLRIRTVYRFVLASAAGALMFLGIAYVSERNNSGFTAILRSQAEMLSSFYIASAGTDAVQQSFLERQMTPDKIMAVMNFIALRGGALVSSMVMFYINRRLACSFAVLIRHIPPKPGLRDFHAPVQLIWVLSFSILGVLLAQVLKSSILGIAAWNMLVLCAMVYLAQGGGIIQYFLARQNFSPFMRLMFNVLIILLILSPGINALALGAVILLGIAENWVPLRTPKLNGPPSTPAA